MRFCFSLLGVLAIVLGGCSETPDPEQHLADTIDAMQQAIEKRERGSFMEHVAEDFTGQRGSYDRQRLDGLIRLHLLRNKSVSSALMGSEISIQGERATVELKVLLTGGAGWLPERGQLYSITTGWRQLDGDWLLLQANWQAAL